MKRYRNAGRPAIALSLLFLLATPGYAQKHTIEAGKLKAQFSPSHGLTKVSLNGKPFASGSTTAFAGAVFTLTRNVPPRDWKWPKNKDTCHFAPSMGRLISRVGNRSDMKVQVVTADKTNYVVRYVCRTGVTLTFSHEVVPPDIICRVTIENDTQDLFQLHDWLAMDFDFGSATQLSRKMSSYYPSANQYSPVTAAWGDKAALGLNWIEHNCRPVEIRFHPHKSSSGKPTRWHCKTWMKNAPVDPGGRSHYTMVMRIDDTPGDWKHLFTPYKQWFNDYFGPVQYTCDFRVKVMSFIANIKERSPQNPLGMRHNFDRSGWGPYISAKLNPLRGHNISHVIFWSVTGSDPRGVNYRPEFNVMPAPAARTLPQLADFCRRNGFGFGFFARPNTIAYKKSLTEDADVEWNPLNKYHVKMADNRFRDLYKQGATAFYLDTYGSSIGCEPYSAEGRVAYLKHLREGVGADPLIFIEHGFDAFHVYAAIWPSGQDKHGKRPIGPFAQWLIPGSLDVCRAHSIEGAKRTWQQGGVPIVNDVQVDETLMQLQRVYVNADRTSKVRKDCRPPGG